MINATIHTYRVSGKWYATGRGVTDNTLYVNCHDSYSRRERLLVLNGDKCPGLRSRGDEFIVVVVPDENVECGFPLMIWPRGVTGAGAAAFLQEASRERT